MADANDARWLAEHLLTIGAVVLSPDQPFTWASGLRAPIYCDNRLTLSFPEVRRAIASGFASHIEAQGLKPDVIAGTATAGIPHAAWLAERLTLPMVYVRSRPKAHGKGNQIEGWLEARQRVVLVEDLISTGGSSLEAVQALREAEAEVVAVLGIFSYGLPVAAQRFADASVPLYTLTDFPTLLAVAAETGYLKPEAVDQLRTWNQDPEAWSEAHAA